MGFMGLSQLPAGVGAQHSLVGRGAAGWSMLLSACFSPHGRSRNNRGMAFELRTPLCRALGIVCPVFSVGFGAGARAELVAAVSNAGGFGVLGASGMPPDALRAEIERTRTLTDRPFGINIIIAQDPAADAEEDREFFRSQVAAAAEAGATAVVLFWGDPAPFVDE